MRQLLQDLRYAAFRTLPKNPGLMVVLVLCLGLGIGVNATLFGIFDLALLRGPSGTEPDRLVRVDPGNSNQISYPNYRDMIGTRGFAGLSANASTTLVITTGGTQEYLSALQVSANFFDLLGVGAFRGRTFTSAEAAPQNLPRMLVLHHRFWKRRFNEDPAVVGRTLIVNREPFVVVGVLGPDFRTGMGLYAPDAYVPISALVSPPLDNRRNAAFTLFARLSPDTTREQAEAAFTAAAQRLESAYPNENRGFGRPAEVVPMSGLASLQRRGLPSELPILLAAPFILFGLLLLLACANVAGVLIARGAARRTEISIRMALGASRASLVRMLLAECLLLTLLGSAAGLIFAFATTALLTQLQLSSFLTLQLPAIRPDSTMIAYALGVAVVTCLASGMVPALQSTRVVLGPDLRDTSFAGRRSRTRKLLVASQVAVSVLLLTACLVFLRSLQIVRGVDPGFDVRSGITARVMPESSADSTDHMPLIALHAVSRLERLPQVRSASFANLVPLGGNAMGRRAVVRDRPIETGMRVSVNNVGPKFFETIGMTVRSGREFQPGDRVGAPPVVIVNETYAGRAFPGRSAIGESIRILTSDADNPLLEIVGVVSDSKYASLSEAPEPQAFRPYLQTGGPLIVQVRTEGAPLGAIGPVREAIAAAAPGLRVDVQTTEAATSLEFELRRGATMLLAAMGALGLLLAMIGLFGVLAWSVSRRTPEIGMRMALGATRASVGALIIKEGLTLVIAGAALGVTAGMAATWPLRQFLAGATASDPMTLAVVTAVILIVGTAASLIPAHRASGIDPGIALRRD